MNLGPADREYAYIPVTAKEADGATVNPSSLQAAVVAPYEKPDEDTEWIDVFMAAPNKGRILVAGPDADPTDAVVIPWAGVDVYVRWTDNPEVISAKVGRVSIG